MRRPRQTSAHEVVFTRIHVQREWGDGESASGPGSGVARTAGIREALPALLRELGVDVLVDAGCGDFHWLRLVDLPVRNYVGVDVVLDLIEGLSARCSRPGRTFVCADITRDKLPPADLILCRELDALSGR